jgi:hypothetical protein
MRGEQTDIIIVRGAPCSGKSLAVKCLSQFFPKGVRMEIDIIRQMVISVDWTNQEEHINMLQVSTGMVYNFLELGFNPIIVVDTFSGDKINRYLETLYQLDSRLEIKIFGLFTTDDELKKRLSLRSEGKFKDFPICKRLNDDVLKIRHDNEVQIDTTGLLPMQTAERIFEQLAINK